LAESLVKPAAPFTEEELSGVYRAIRERRDVRSGFLPEPLPDNLLLRLLEAAHQAPSVGLMQPWQFILIRSLTVRKEIHKIFQESNQAAQAIYSDDRAELYSRLKLEAILTAPQNLCVVYDPGSLKGHHLGRSTMPETALYSVVCAVQNLWLAARAEAVGVGWVSILDPDAIKATLHIPTCLVPVAYLCLGYVESFGAQPELERVGWEHRSQLSDVLHSDYFDQPYVAGAPKR
jgi:5,6-dimethylbenzimidazole synthase